MAYNNTSIPFVISLLYFGMVRLLSLSRLPSFYCPFVYFTLGRGGESGVPSAGPGQVFVTNRHEETPEDFAHVLGFTLR